jgi:hypothetical protein
VIHNQPPMNTTLTTSYFTMKRRLASHPNASHTQRAIHVARAVTATITLVLAIAGPLPVVAQKNYEWNPPGGANGWQSLCKEGSECLTWHDSGFLDCDLTALQSVQLSNGTLMYVPLFYNGQAPGPNLLTLPLLEMSFTRLPRSSPPPGTFPGDF